MKTHSFNGKRYNIRDISECPEKLLGLCSHPDMPEREMFVPVNGDTLDELIVLLHEPMHASVWCLDEETIEQMSVDIGKFLWRLGWRKE